jgi:hypothetical protein
LFSLISGTLFVHDYVKDQGFRYLLATFREQRHFKYIKRSAGEKPKKDLKLNLDIDENPTERKTSDTDPSLKGSAAPYFSDKIFDE